MSTNPAQPWRAQWKPKTEAAIERQTRRENNREAMNQITAMRKEFAQMQIERQKRGLQKLRPNIHEQIEALRERMRDMAAYGARLDDLKLIDCVKRLRILAFCATEIETPEQLELAMSKLDSVEPLIHGLRKKTTAAEPMSDEMDPNVQLANAELAEMVKDASG